MGMSFKNRQILELNVPIVTEMFLVYVIKLLWPPDSDIIAYSVASILVWSYKGNLQFNTCYSSAIPMSASSVLPKMWISFFICKLLNPGSALWCHYVYQMPKEEANCVCLLTELVTCSLSSSWAYFMLLNCLIQPWSPSWISPPYCKSHGCRSKVIMAINSFIARRFEDFGCSNGARLDICSLPTHRDPWKYIAPVHYFLQWIHTEQSRWVLHCSMRFCPCYLSSCIPLCNFNSVITY